MDSEYGSGNKCAGGIAVRFPGKGLKAALSNLFISSARALVLAKSTAAFGGGRARGMLTVWFLEDLIEGAVNIQIARLISLDFNLEKM